MPLLNSIINQNVRSIVALKKKRRNLVKSSEAFAQTDENKVVSKTEENTLLETIEANAWVYAAIYKIATSVASCPFKIYYTLDDGSLMDITNEEEFLVLRNPNNWFTRFDFWEATIVYLESAGRAFWELVKDGDRIVEMYPLKPSLMKPIKDRKKFITGWTYEVNGKKIPYGVDDIVFLRYFNPNNPYSGLSPLKPGSNSVAIDIFSQNYSMSFFKNSGRPDGLLIYDAELGDDDYDRIRKNWEKSHGGISQSHRIAIIEQGMQYKQIATTQKDAEFVKQRKLSRDEILAVMGVPPATVGVFESAIKANAEVQERMFWTETMIPKLIKMSEMVKLAIVRMMLPKKKYDINKIVTMFDTSQVHILMEALREHEDKLIEHVKNGTMSRNESRIILNHMYGNILKLKPFEGGNKIILPQNVVNEIGIVEENESQKVSYQKAEDNNLKLINLKKQDEEEIITGLTFEITSPEAITALSIKPMLVVTSKTNNEIVRRIVKDGLEKAQDIKDMQAEIWDRFSSSGDFSINRTTRIARTETTQIANVATLDSYKQSKVVEKKIWLTSRDLKVRPATKFDKGDHRVLDGEERNLNEAFSNGLMYPGDQSGKPEENVNCRCTMLSKPIEEKGIIPLFTSSDNEIMKTVLWKKFINEIERFELQIKNLFLQMFENIGNKYIKKLSDTNVNLNTIDLILLDDNSIASEMEKMYKPLKEAIMKEYGQIQLNKLVT